MFTSAPYPAAILLIFVTSAAFAEGQQRTVGSSDPVVDYSVVAPNGDSGGAQFVADAHGNAYFAVFQGSGDGNVSGQTIVVKLGADGTPNPIATMFGWQPISMVAGLDGSIYLGLYPDCPDQSPACVKPTTKFGTQFPSVAVAKFNATGQLMYLDAMEGGDILIAVDSAGAVYFVGNDGCGFPTTPGAFQTTCPAAGATSPIAARIRPDGVALDFATYLGRTDGPSTARSIAIDQAGNLYVTGTGLPGTPGAYFQSPANTVESTATSDSISKLNANGTGVVWSTFFPARIAGIGIDQSGAVYVTGMVGETVDSNGQLTATLVATPGAAETVLPLAGQAVGFLAKLNPAATGLVFATYLGLIQEAYFPSPSINGTPALRSRGIVNQKVTLDSAGNAYVISETFRSNALTVQPIQASYGSDNLTADTDFLQGDGAIVRVTPDGSAITFSSYLGGHSEDAPTSISVDSAGNMYVGGHTGTYGPKGVQFPSTQTTPGGAASLAAFAVKIAARSGANPMLAYETSSQFNSVQVGASATLAATLGNYGDTSLPLNSITISGDGFTETNDCGTSIPAASRCRIVVKFASTVAGSFTGTVTATTPVGARAINFSATATPAPDFTIASGSTSQSVTAGQTATYALSVLPQAGFAGAVSLSCSGAPQAASCAVSPASVNVSGTAATMFTVSVTTTARTAGASVLPRPTGPAGWVLLLLFGGLASAWFGKTGKTFLAVIKPLCAVALMAVMMGCGGGSGSTKTPVQVGTPAGTYTIVVSATSGSATHTQNLTLAVQ